MSVTIRTSDGVILRDVEVVRESICAIQKTKAMKAFNTLGEYVSYDGHRINAKSRVSLKNSVPMLLQDLELCDLQGKVYSGDSNVFIKKFAECLTCFLGGLRVLLRENKAGQKVKRIAITASELEDGLKWLIPVMKVVGCYDRFEEIQIGNVIRDLESRNLKSCEVC
jgi:hypothetical protein